MVGSPFYTHNSGRIIAVHMLCPQDTYPLSPRFTLNYIYATLNYIYDAQILSHTPAISLYAHGAEWPKTKARSLKSYGPRSGLVSASAIMSSVGRCRCLRLL